MSRTSFPHLRRRLTLAGGHAATAAAEGAGGRRDVPGYRPAEMVEGPLRAVPVGPAVPWTESVAFLDGTQHVELLGYVDTHPVIAAELGAAVRQRDDRRMRRAVEERRQLVLGRSQALALLSRSLSDEVTQLAIEDEEPPHPIADVDRAHALVDRARTALEISVAATFRATAPDTWLLVDGSLATSPDWARDPRMLGIVKSHATLPFAGDELRTYLTLPVGHRTTVFAPATRLVAPVHAWGLRLHEWGGHDLFHGLIRVEAAASSATLANADDLSRRLLAERAPLATDPRADRLLYGIHDVERYLRARAVRG